MTTYQSHPRATRPNALAGKRRRPSPSHCHTHASTPQHNKNTQKHAKTHAQCPPLRSTTGTSATGNERKQLSKSDDRKTPRKRPQISRIKPNPQFHLQINRDGIGWMLIEVRQDIREYGPTRCPITATRIKEARPAYSHYYIFT